MSVLSCAHVHTTFCDGRSPAAETARTALEKGFVSLGFSSHAPQRFDPSSCVPPQREQDYRAEVLALQKQYEGRMRVYLGIERDLYACVSPEQYDYFIASVHYFPTEEGYLALDGDPEELRLYVDRYCGGDAMKMLQRYFALTRDYVLSARPPIIGHFDLPRKNNAKLKLFDEDGPAYREAALDALRPLADTGALLEVNTGGMARKGLKTPYPAPFLLSEWRAWGGEVIINSDCHDAKDLDAFFPEMEELLRSLGYDHAVRLGRTEMWERFSLT